MQLVFRTKLMIIMGVFSIVLTLSISFVNQHRWKESLIANDMRESSLVEDIIITAVTDADKAYNLLDYNLDNKMREYSERLLLKYRDNPDVASWDYNALKHEFDGMDIYIIDDTLTILHSSFVADIGLNFKETDGTLGIFAKLLLERLEGNTFVTDGLDQESNTGKIKKYSYMPTHDHKYLIELGLDQEDHLIFQSFNFLEIVNNLVEKYNNVVGVTLYTTSGKAMGKSGEDGKTLLVSEENKFYFHKAHQEEQVQEVTRIISGSPVTYRYVPYRIELGNELEKHTDQRVIEIIYSEEELRNKLTQNNQIFLLQLLITLICALIISYIISRLVARPMYLAFHDSLTGLSNRAAVEASLDLIIEKNKKNARKTGLMIIDLDHFKQVNDLFGHDTGDYFLKEVGRRIRSAARHSDDMIARLGGDEFIVVLNDADDYTASQIAQQIIEELKRPIEVQGVDIVRECRTTASIGIALAPDHASTSDELYNCADQALYHAKRTTKNTYSVYNDSMKSSPLLDK